MPAVLAIFYPLLQWVAKLFVDRSINLALAGFMIATVVAYAAVITGIVAVIGNSIPASARDVLSFVMPSEWALQLAALAAIQSTAMAHQAFMRAIALTAKG